MGYNECTSLLIYRRANEMSAKTFFYELRQAVYREVKAGESPLINELIVTPLHSFRPRPFGNSRDFHIPALVVLAIDQALTKLESGTDFPELRDSIRIHSNTVLPWTHFDEFGIHYHTYMLSLDYMRQLENRYSQLCASTQELSAKMTASGSKSEDDLEKAQREATRILENAKAEAARITQSATENAEHIRNAALQQAAAEAAQNVAALTQQQLSSYIQELRRQWEEAQRERSDQQSDTSALAAQLKEDACTVSTTVGANLNRGLDQIQEQINQLRSTVTVDLQQWRTSLYQCEYGKLINFYSVLNGYANSFDREYREAECSDSVSEELKKVLGEHSHKLNRMRSNLISAMEPMGLRLFTPQKGDLFNSYYHTTNEEEDDDVFLDREIERCLKPGVERIVNSRETAVLLRASVEVQKE